MEPSITDQRGSLSFRTVRTRPTDPVDRREACRWCLSTPELVADRLDAPLQGRGASGAASSWPPEPEADPLLLLRGAGRSGPAEGPAPGRQAQRHSQPDRRSADGTS